MKCSFSARAVEAAAVLAQLVLVGADLLLAEAAPPQLHHGPLQLAAALPLQAAPAAGPSRRPRSSAAVICSRARLVLLVFQLPAELVADRVAQLGLDLESAQFVEQLGVQLGQLELLDLQHLEDRP